MEAGHRVPDRLEHPLRLAVAALVERELEPAPAEASRSRGRGETVVELDALGEPAERVVVQLALDFDLVDLLDAVARVRKPVRELAVVREQ